jgi:hypothetical protein
MFEGYRSETGGSVSSTPWGYPPRRLTCTFTIFAAGYACLSLVEPVLCVHRLGRCIADHTRDMVTFRVRSRGIHSGRQCGRSAASGPWVRAGVRIGCRGRWVGVVLLLLCVLGGGRLWCCSRRSWVSRCSRASASAHPPGGCGDGDGADDDGGSDEGGGPVHQQRPGSAGGVWLPRQRSVRARPVVVAKCQPMRPAVSGMRRRQWQQVAMRASR